jgi:hypothetical protein
VTTQVSLQAQEVLPWWVMPRLLEPPSRKRSRRGGERGLIPPF